MSTFADTIKDDTVLAAKLAVVLNSDLPDFLDTTYSERERVHAKRLHMMIAAVFLFSIAVSFYLLDIDFSSWSERIMGGITMCWVAVFVVSGRSWFTSKRLLAREMNMAMTPLITNTLDTMSLYTHTEDTPGEVSGVMHELLQKSDVEIISKDRYQVFAEPVMQFDAVHVSRQASQFVTEAGGAEVATGVLVTAAAAPELNGLVAVSSEHHHLIESVWELASAGTYVMSVPEVAAARICVPAQSTQEEVTKRGVVEVLAFLAQYHKAGYICAVRDGQLQLLLLGDSIQIPVGASTTDRTVIARQGYQILQPIWKGARVAEVFAGVV